MSTPPTPPELLAEIRGLHSQGLNDVEISKRVYMSSGHVSALRRRLGLPLNLSSQRKAAAERYALVRAHILAGKSDVQICCELGFSYGVVRRVREKFRLLVGRKGPAGVPDSRLRELAAQGLSTAEIAERVGLCAEHVCKRRRLLGIPASRMVHHFGQSDLQPLVEAGLSRSAIARRLGCSASLIRLRIQQYGIEPNPTSAAHRTDTWRAQIASSYARGRAQHHQTHIHTAQVGAQAGR